MAEFQELSRGECEAILTRNYYGRLACYSPSQDESYAIPLTYDYQNGTLYFATLEGQTLAYLREHPRGVCLEVDEVDTEQSWASVVAVGDVEEIADPERLAREPAAHRRASEAAFQFLFRRYSQAFESGTLHVFALRVNRLTGRRERWEWVWKGPPKIVRKRR